MDLHAGCFELRPETLQKSCYFGGGGGGGGGTIRVALLGHIHQPLL